MQVYLDEFVFRHNRRGVPMASFQTLLGLGLAHEPVTPRDHRSGGLKAFGANPVRQSARTSRREVAGCSAQ